MKSTKICARIGCNNEFKLYKTTDKYCSSKCAYLDNLSKPKNKQYKIKQYSEKRKTELILYSKNRKSFLSLPENRYCPVMKHVFNKFVYSCEIHHKAGRKGKLLNHTTYWLAVSREGHVWIHSNPEEAYKFGFLLHSSQVTI